MILVFSLGAFRVQCLAFEEVLIRLRNGSNRPGIEAVIPEILERVTVFVLRMDTPVGVVCLGIGHKLVAF